MWTHTDPLLIPIALTASQLCPAQPHCCLGCNPEVMDWPSAAAHPRASSLQVRQDDYGQWCVSQHHATQSDSNATLESGAGLLNILLKVTYPGREVGFGLPSSQTSWPSPQKPSIAKALRSPHSQVSSQRRPGLPLLGYPEYLLSKHSVGL